MATTKKKEAPPPESNGNRPPIQRFHYPVYNGTLSVSIFDKQIATENGEKTVYSVSVQRSYPKDDKRAWTSYLRDTDVAVAVLGLQEAFRYIAAMRQRQFEDSNGAQGEDIPF